METVVHARAGLLGNPSDGYYGKTLSCLVGNYKARVILTESDSLRLQPHPRFDPMEFTSIAELALVYGDQGYYGGMRLLQAACKRFYETCCTRQISLRGPNFTLSYETDIPRQVGLAGSSALVIATLRSLMKWYHVQPSFLQAEFPTLALETEQVELGITAGMQDRVIQTYGGVMYMDFNRQLMEERGYGSYERIDATLLPPLFLAYVEDPSDSGVIHSDVRRRWHEGDQEIHQAMHTFAGFADEGKCALAARDYSRISELLGAAFSLRRKIFGEAVLGAANLRMVEIAREHDVYATTCGSGGAIIGVIRDERQNTLLADSLKAEGFRFVPIIIGPEYEWKDEG